jgi:hypothetical protein
MPDADDALGDMAEPTTDISSMPPGAGTPGPIAPGPRAGEEMSFDRPIPA